MVLGGTDGEREALAPGQVVAGRYRVERMLGRGGMGAVYEAEHVALRRTVALKVLLPSLSGDPEVVARFLREARAAASVGHPGIVEVFDLGADAGTVFLAMEKLEGEELAARISRVGPLPWALAARIGADLADAIAAAHAAGIVHRDLKPQNVFLARRGRASDVVKVLDFGIAKLTESDEIASSPLTRTGQVFGTPIYMAPEQLRGAKSVDARADVYAIGVILFEALTGRPPFTAETYAELVLRICGDEVPSLGSLRPGIPEALRRIVERAMARDLAARVPSARELATELEALLAQDLPDAPPADALAATMPALSAESPRSPSSALPVRAPGRRRAGVLAGAGVLAAGLAAVIALAGARMTRSDPVAAGAAGAVQLAPAVRDEPPSELARSDAPPPVPPEPPVVPTPTRRNVAFDVGPAGTVVEVNGERVCEAPCSAELEDIASVFVFSRPGHATEERSFAAPLPERIQVQLVPSRRARGRGGEGAPGVSLRER